MDPTFKQDDLVGARDLFNRLKKPPDGDLVSAMLVALLRENTTKLLGQHTLGDNPSTELITAMKADLNAIISRSSLYARRLFPDQILTPGTKELLQPGRRRGDDVRVLNRMLLQDAYPDFDRRDYHPLPGIRAAIRSWGNAWYNLVTLSQEGGVGEVGRAFGAVAIGIVRESGLMERLQQIDEEAGLLGDDPPDLKERRTAWIEAMDTARAEAILMRRTLEKRRAAFTLTKPDRTRGAPPGATIEVPLTAGQQWPLFFKRVAEDLSKTLATFDLDFKFDWDKLM
jgi:hypothetical protein